ncbi:hypothetical protein ABKN59_004474 [Abortiporus biennis]
MQTAKPVSPSKGKAKEESHWQLDWWELYPLFERARKPIAWSRSSVIFAAHPTQALVLARHFSSSRQFILSSPPPIGEVPSSYGSPTVISVSPDEAWLFAYFPGHDSNGVACIWQRGSQLDSWTVFDWWNTQRGAGIVTSDWTGAEREWVVTDSGIPTRLPPRGPVVPVNSPTLLLVTQSNQVNVCFLRPAVQKMRILRASLTHTSSVSDNAQTIPEDMTECLGGERICVCAAFGLNYNEHSILVATRSRIIPPKRPVHHDMGLGLAPNFPDMSSTSEDVLFDEWESWGDESTIDLCEVAIDTNGVLMIVRTKPLPSIFQSGSCLTDLSFFSIPPELPVLASPTATKDPRRQNKESPFEKKGQLYLTASFIDCEDYTSVPKTELILYSLVRNALPAGITGPRWSTRKETTRTFTKDPLVFLAPTATRKGIYAGFLSSSGMLRNSLKVKECPIGNMVVLTLPGLTDDGQFESCPILSTFEAAGKNVPAGVVCSPNTALLCTVSSTAGARLSVHSIPRLSSHSGTITTKFSSPSTPKASLPKAICAALYSRKSPCDVIHALTLKSTPIHTVISAIHSSISIMESNPYGLPEVWFDELLGIITEVYLGRARHANSDEEKEEFTSKWKAVHNICSVATLCSAFDECREGDAYDLDAIWQLVGISSWFVDFLEKLVKECVTAQDALSLSKAKSEIKSEDTDEISVLLTALAQSPLASPVFLHLIHLYALRNLHQALSHVRTFRTHLSRLTAKAEHGQIAKDVMMDIVDCCGVDLDGLDPILTEALAGAQKINADDLRKSIALCRPVPSTHTHIQQTIEKITTMKVIDKPKLFIKPSDLIDGVMRMSLSDRLREKDTDVVTKSVLVHPSRDMICVRCGGKSEVEGGSVRGKTHSVHTISLRWLAWENMWSSRCICGGAWTGARAPISSQPTSY